jgi:glycosyltransferase involved in cell wall biosynthesis
MSKVCQFYNKVLCLNINFFYFLKENLIYFFVKKKKVSLFLNKNPLVSIILPTFNRSQMLKTRSIRSVLKQSYKNFELLVISDGSTDDTEELVKSFKDQRIKFCKILRNKKRYTETAINHWFAGPVMAINKGLCLATGDWIARIDDDDIWTKDHLKHSLDLLYQTKSEFVSSKRMELRDGIFKITKEDKKWIYDADYKIQIGGVNTWVYAGYLKFCKANINCWRKERNRVNDTDLIARMLNLGIKICFLNKPTHIAIPRKKNSLFGSRYYIENEKEILDNYNIK